MTDPASSNNNEQQQLNQNQIRPTTIGDTSSSTTIVPHRAVVDIEDLHYVTICGLRRRRPPIVPFLCPFRIHLEPGKLYRYCTCGRSANQPWCDDSHTYADTEPLEFSVSVEQSWHLLCGCKYTQNPPFCDGSHIHAVDGYEEVGSTSSSSTGTIGLTTEPNNESAADSSSSVSDTPRQTAPPTPHESDSRLGT